MIRTVSLVLALVLASCGPKSGEGPVEPSPEPEPEVETDPKECQTPEDCVPVGCTCSCSGCGGFSAQDIVNREHVEAWYEEHGCEPAEVCPMVCCPPATIVCEAGQCGVVTGEAAILE